MTRFGFIKFGPIVGVALVCGAYASAQSAISAHSGMVHYVEGKVLLDGQAVDPKFGEFPEVKNNQVLETAEGRAEVLLTPGVFLRLAENTSFKMLSNKLSDTALEVLSGAAIVEVDELLKDNAITLRYKDATIALTKAGLYRVDSGTERMRVYDGEASVTYGLKTVEVHKGKQVQLSDGLLASTFDAKDTDAFYRWVARRSEYIASANVSSARAAGVHGLNASVPCQGQASTSSNPSALIMSGPSAYCNPYGDPYGYGNGYGYGYYSPYGSWAWNPYFGMFTYLPGYGYGYNPFGWVIYSPVTVGSVYVPGNFRNQAVTATGNHRAVGPTSLAGVRSPSSVAPAATAATAMRANSVGSGAISPSRAGVVAGPSASSAGVARAGGGVSSGSTASSSGGGMSAGRSSGGGGVSSGGGGHR